MSKIIVAWLPLVFEIVKTADENNDGKIDMDELNRFVYGPKFWKAVWVVDNSEEAINKYSSFFTEGKLKKLDIDGNGKVDDAELRGYSLQYIKEWMDIDHDSVISKWEFEMNMNILMGDGSA
uniref:EF-hand domain-containing protein n=1 Tax=Meloidogyne hapla TaxID=6305 RepID=A0A1I8BPK8_MELHA